MLSNWNKFYKEVTITCFGCHNRNKTYFNERKIPDNFLFSLKKTQAQISTQDVVVFSKDT